MAVAGFVLGTLRILGVRVRSLRPRARPRRKLTRPRKPRGARPPKPEFTRPQASRRLLVAVVVAGIAGALVVIVATRWIGAVLRNFLS